MGWNDWARYGCSTDTPHPGDVGPSEQLILTQAASLVSTGLAAKGYHTVSIDGCWMAQTRDSNGNLVANPSTFPDGMPYLASRLHGLGLKLGIYEDAGTLTCGGYPGSWGHFQQDASLFASWTVDYLKLDGCSMPTVPGQTAEQTYQQAYSQMSQALKNSGRDIVFSESAPSYFHLTPDWYAVLGWVGQYGQLWRDGPDIAMHETPATSRWHSVLTNYGYNNTLVRYASPGNWNDPDQLIAGDTGLTSDESKSQVALWAMMAAPMILSSDLTSLSTDAVSVLGNTDVIAVDQDPLGQQGTVVSQTGTLDVLDKPLANGDHAVALLNQGAAPVPESTSTTAIGLFGKAGCSFMVKDLWTGSQSTTTGRIAATVPAHGTAIFRISPASGCALSRPSGQIRGDVGMCVEDRGSAAANGNPAVLARCNGAPKQHWTVPGDGTLRTLGKCLEVAGGSVAAGASVDMNLCTNSAAEKWQARPDGSLLNPRSGLCADDPNLSTADGTQLQMAVCTSNLREQTWSVPTPVVRRIVSIGGNCVENVNGSAANGNPVVLAGCAGGSGQHWSLPGDGTVRTSGKCLDIAGGAANAGALLAISACAGVGTQQWLYQSSGNLINPPSGLCVEDPNGTTATGTQLRVEPCGANQPNQTWYLPT
jgi:alpha-galactosidase